MTTNTKPVAIRLPIIDAEKLESLDISGRELLSGVLRLIEAGDLKIRGGELKVFTPEKSGVNPDNGLDTSRLEYIAASCNKTPQQVLDMMLNKYAGY